MKEKKIQIDEEAKQLLSSKDQMPEEIQIKGKKYYLKKFISAKGHKSIVWKGLDEFNYPFAIKFAIYEDYMERSFLQECERAVKLRDYPEYFAYFYDADIVEIMFKNGKKRKFICFIEEWIEGTTLDEFIQNYEITPSFYISYVKHMGKALDVLKKLNLRHDDLHSGNVMILIKNSEYRIKIIDTGSLKQFDSALTKPKDDIGNFAEHLILLYNALLFDRNKQRKPLCIMQKRFREEIKLLIFSMLEEDPQIALSEPSKIISQFEHAYTRAQFPYEEVELKLEDPFDYISAEHIANDKLLVNLFAESCPWVKEIVSPNPILLTGPRGCGKSMIFRRFSLRALLLRSKEEIKESPIAGFYISCSTDFRNRFGWITSESVIDRFKNEIVHYFNLLLCREICFTLLLISKREDRGALFGFGEIQEKDLFNFLIEKMHLKQEEVRLQGVTPLEHILDIVESKINYCYERFIRGYNLDPQELLSFPFIQDFTKFLKNKIGYFRERTIVLFLDDYSVHRISKQVQLILNQIIWDRQPTHVFKLSSEKYGAETLYLFSTESSPTADFTREYREIDCGQYYIDLSDKDLQKELLNFAKEVLDHRLKLAGYQGTCETIIGHSKYPEGNLGKALAVSGKTKREDYYHGIETISEICSGDISALLEIYRRIFIEGKVDKTTQSQVSKHIQHRAIKRVSRNFLNLIKAYYPKGEEMYKIVESFGSLCRKILVYGKEMTYKLPNGSTESVPCQTSRIEVHYSEKATEEFTEEQEKLKKELVRRCIFIEMEPGRARATSGTTIRWQLRRIYCPAFSLSLTKNTAIKWSMSEFKYFLIDPKSKCESEFEKWKDHLKTDPSPLFPQLRIEDEND